MNDYKNKLRYVIARYSYSTAVFAWEFFNEVCLLLCNGAIHHLLFVRYMCIFVSICYCLYMAICACMLPCIQVDLTDNYETTVQANWTNGMFMIRLKGFFVSNPILY